MNNLNSVIIEGVVATSVEEVRENLYEFTLLSKRTTIVDASLFVANNFFKIRTDKKDVLLKKYAAVRIIGSLEELEDKSVCIVAGHIEFKPSKPEKVLDVDFI